MESTCNFFSFEIQFAYARTDQMSNLGGHIAKSSAGKHHQYKNAYIRRQNECVKSLLPVLESRLFFSNISSPLTNIITCQVFSDDISKNLLSFETTETSVYKEFVDERLNSTESINEPIKKVMLKSCKFAIKSRKVFDRAKELRGNCNLFVRWRL